MEEHAAYHLARANIMEKILQEGNIKDLKSKNHKNYLKFIFLFYFLVFIYEEDEKQSRRLRMTAQTLRTHYTTILDTITKVGFQITSITASRSPGRHWTVSFGLGWVHIRVQISIALFSNHLKWNSS